MAVRALDELKPVYLIFGDEELLLDRALHRLRDRVAEVADLDFNFEAFDGGSADANEVVAAANTLPFASDRRLVVVRNVDKMRADDQAVLAAYARNPAPTACLVLVAAKIRKDSKLYKAVSALGGAAEYKAPEKRAVPTWVIELFAARGRRLDRDGAEALVHAVGRNLRRLETEAEKIIASAGERTNLTRADVENVVAETAPVSVFDFLRALADRRATGALELLDDLLASGEEILGVHAMTARQVRTLVSTRALIDRGANQAAVMREVGMADWQARQAIEQARRFTSAELARALGELAEVERRLKSGDGEPRVVFEMWLMAFCSRR